VFILQLVVGHLPSVASAEFKPGDDEDLEEEV
jgi:hypothetical protein